MRINNNIYFCNVFSYISDSIDVKSRPKYQSKICGMVCVAYVVGPLVGSSLVNIHLRLPLYIKKIHVLMYI